MKIDPSKLPHNIYVKQPEVPSEKRPSAMNQVDSPAGDAVHISSTSRELSQLRAEVKELSDVRAEKVANLRDRIARGEYQVNAQAVADRILEQSVHLRRQAQSQKSE